jgi:uncharacterized protein YcfJ
MEGFMRLKGLLVATMTLTACATNIGTGAIAGGILGAGSGALMGNGKGALIGSAVGVIGGGLIGVALDMQDRKVMERSSPRTVDRMDRTEPLTINDVIKLSQGGVSDDTILKYMDESHSIYNLSQAQIRRLQEGGVSQRVIQFMIHSGQQ